MTTSTIVLIVAVAIVAILCIAAIAWVAQRKRSEHRRVEAAEIRDRAAEQSHAVGQKEALADETAAKARAAQAEADAKAAHAAALHHQAELHRGDAATARNDVDHELDRANRLDPDTDGAARDASNSEQNPSVTPEAR